MVDGSGGGVAPENWRGKLRYHCLEVEMWLLEGRAMIAWKPRYHCFPVYGRIQRRAEQPSDRALRYYLECIVSEGSLMD